jgi:hypothetical protein
VTLVQRAYRISTVAFGVLVVILGMAMIAVSVARGGGVASYGVIVGIAFTLLGVGRLYLARMG